MTTDSRKSSGIDRGVKVRIDKSAVEIAPNEEGEIFVAGRDLALVRNLSDFLHERVLFRGRTRGDALRAAIIVAKRFHGEVLDLESQRSRVRGVWIGLLRSHLAGDPAQVYGRNMNVLRTYRGLCVSFAAYKRRGLSSDSASVFVGDPKHLIVHPGTGNRWQVRWEDLIRVSFLYSDEIVDLQAMSDTDSATLSPWFEQKVAELKAELDKFPADRQEQLRRELKDEGGRKS